MTFIDLATKNPETFSSKTVEQIVAFCGDGKLRDKSTCSEQFRQFLKLQSLDVIAGYAKYCLENKFDRSGFTLQDCVNEIGRRLGYDDGKHFIVVEVKTTDAYRINLDKIRNYIDKIETNTVPVGSSVQILIVVGRQDTGDLEAQIRGSRHAWSTRLISVDALIKLMFINEELDQAGLQDKIRRILMPFEYTRVDNIVDLVFETQQETETKVAAEADSAEGDEDSSKKFDFTPKAELDKKRIAIVSSFFKKHGKTHIQRSRVNFSNAENDFHVTCAVFKNI